jgi:hypothetical protein
MIHGSFNGNGGKFNASRTREAGTPPQRCCARCKSPYFCGNPDCKCHTPQTLEQLMATIERTDTK